MHQRVLIAICVLSFFAIAKNSAGDMSKTNEKLKSNHRSPNSLYANHHDDLKLRIMRMLSSGKTTISQSDTILSDIKAQLRANNTDGKIPDEMMTQLTRLRLRLRLMRAEIFTRQERHSESKKEVREAISLSKRIRLPLDPETRYLIGKAMLSIGMRQEASANLNTCTTPDTPSIVQAKALWQLGRWHESASPSEITNAKNECEKAIKADPSFLTPYFDCANIFIKEKQYAKATKLTERAFREYQKRLQAINQVEDLQTLFPNNPIIEQQAHGLAGSIKTILEKSIDSSTVIMLADTNTGAVFRFIYVPPGKYVTGYNEKQQLRVAKQARDPAFGYNALGQVEVTLKSGFFILDREITEQQWQTVFGEDSDAINPDSPQTNIDWRAACLFCQKLGEQFGIHIRLPYEVEWEIAARPSGDWVYPWGNEVPIAENIAKKQRKINSTNNETKDRTPSGIKYLAGNVSEWCGGEYNNKMVNTDSIVWDPSRTKSPFIFLKNDLYYLLYENGTKISRRKVRPIRGGSNGSDLYSIQVPTRRGKLDTTKTEFIGFRPIISSLKEFTNAESNSPETDSSTR